jgi:hypothetical protein
MDINLLITLGILIVVMLSLFLIIVEKRLNDIHKQVKREMERRNLEMLDRLFEMQTLVEALLVQLEQKDKSNITVNGYECHVREVKE